MKKLDHRDYKVIIYLLGRNIKDNSFIEINHSTICRELNLSRSEVSKAIKNLIENEILEANNDFQYTHKKKMLKLKYHEYNDLDGLVHKLMIKNMEDSGV
jgi:hypothetical protein